MKARIGGIVVNQRRKTAELPACIVGKLPTCDYCSEPIAYIIPGIPNEGDSKLCEGHASDVGMNLPAFRIKKDEP